MIRRDSMIQTGLRAGVRGALSAATILSRVARRISRLARRKPLGAIAGMLLVVFLITALFADRIAPHHYSDIGVGAVLTGPTADHWFGTDELGRDIFSRIVYGARLSAIVGLGSVVLSIGIATAIGLVSGYFGGRIDFLLQRLVDFWMAFPPIVLLIALAAIFGTSTLQIVLIIGIFFAGGPSRIIRGSVLSTREMQFVLAARSIGASDARLILVHILPNVVPAMIVLGTVQAGYAILTEATLSFLGYGIPPPFPSWGRMLAGSGISYAYVNPWVAVWPGLAILAVVWATNIFGDSLRDLTDPRLARAA